MSKAKLLGVSLAAIGLVAVCVVAPFSGDTAASPASDAKSQSPHTNLRAMSTPAVSVDQCSTGTRPSPLCGGDYDCGPFGRCENGGCTCTEGWCLDYSRHCTLPANADGSCPSPNDNKGCDMYYRNVNGVCEDIDECRLGITNCAQHCINSQGGFYCGCDEGYTVGWYGWQSSCNDVDECATDNGGCAQTCTNTDGSFTCGCNAGFALNADGQTCDDVDECAVNNGGCAQTCTNTDGSFTCGCNAGFALNADGQTCDDVDECAVNNGGCAQTCTNTDGSFTCGCNAGFALNADGQTCDDVDECAVNNGGCAQTCTNTDGSFTCGCNAGFSLNADGQTCDVVDICAVNNGGCSDICTSTGPGTADCSCNVGFTLNADGKTCDDVNECAVNNGGCAQTCTNTDGSFTCGCNAGYRLNADGVSCAIDCSDNEGGCEQIYDSQSGECSCNTGYTLAADLKSCVSDDIPLDGCRIHMDASVDDREPRCQPQDISKYEVIRCGNRPEVSTFNNKAAFVYGAEHDHGLVRLKDMHATASQPTRGGDVSVAFVVVPDRSYTSQHVLMNARAGGHRRHQPLFLFYGETYQSGDNGNGQRYNGLVSNDEAQVYVTTLKSLSADRNYRNGAYLGRPGPGRNWHPIMNDVQNWNMMPNFRGAVSEVIVWDRLLNDTERTAVTNHLMSKWMQ